MHPGWAAAGLAGHGVAKGDRVALLSRNSDEFAAIAWGAARLGVTLVPINFMLTGDEVGYIVGDAQPEFVDTATEAIAASGPSPGAKGEGPLRRSRRDRRRRLGGAAGGRRRPDPPEVHLRHRVTAEGGPCSLRAPCRRSTSARSSTAGMTGDDVDLHTLPLYHCAQLDCFLRPDLVLGATSIILPAPEQGAVLAGIAEHG